jgi:hypothetical protein
VPLLPWIAALVLLAAVIAMRLATLRTYRALERLRPDMRARYGRFISPAGEHRTAIAFGDHLCAIPELLDCEPFERLRTAAERIAGAQRSYIPGHKAGATVSYAELHRLAPELVAFYLSDEVARICSRLFAVAVQPTPLHDQSSCSLLVYERPGDHIGWHYDHDFYRGRHFTVLLPLINQRSGAPGTSSAQLEAQIAGSCRFVPTPPNTLVLFEGARVRHRVTPLGVGEQRILLSMTFCTDPRSHLLAGMMRRMKDTAYYGLRALWS